VYRVYRVAAARREARARAAAGGAGRQGGPGRTGIAGSFVADDMEPEPEVLLGPGAVVAAAAASVAALSGLGYLLARTHHDSSGSGSAIGGSASVDAGSATCTSARRRSAAVATWGSPICAMAPMVGQSDYPFRALCRHHGATACWSEMLMADRFAAEAGYRIQALGRGGVRANDHPLIVQFAANRPKDFTAAALEAEKLGADGVDLNLGCPQRRARTGHYGSYLTDPGDWLLCCEMVRAAVLVTTIPITVKIRLQQTTAETLEFAEKLARAGASLLTLHARRRGREDKRRDGAADLTVVAAIVARFRKVGLDKTCAVLSNGNVRCATDVKINLAKTGATGLMVGEQLLRDPALFARVDHRMERLGGAPKWQCGGAALALQYALTCERVAKGSTLFGGGGRSSGGGAPRRRCRLDDGSRPPGGTYSCQ
jgi:tRNA-dihydrouridine synthase 1